VKLTENGRDHNRHSQLVFFTNYRKWIEIYSKPDHRMTIIVRTTLTSVDLN